MAQLIDQVGDYRGKAVNGAVSTTTNGFPQLVLNLHATSVYDGELSEWVDDVVDSDITAYLCLFGGSGKPTLAVQQVIDVIGWDGASFKGLNDLVKELIEDEGGLPIGFSVDESVYEGKTRLNVNWIRPYDATPTRAVKECTPAELKILDQQYARALQAVRGKTKAAAPKPTTKPKLPVAPAFQTAPEPAIRPAPSATGKSTKGRAWGAIVKANKAEPNVENKGGGAGFGDEQLVEVWQTTIVETVGDVDDKQITREQWYQIQEAGKAKVTVPF